MGIKKKNTKGMREIVRQNDRIRVLKEKQRQLIYEEFPVGSGIWLLPQQNSPAFLHYTVIMHNYSGGLKIENSKGVEKWIDEIPWLLEEGKLLKSSEVK